MAPALTWRPATAADDDAVTARSVQLYIEDPGPRTITADDVRRTLAVLRAEPWRGLAVVLAGEVVAGYALLISFWSNEAGGELCTVDEFYVDAVERGRGQGSALFAQIPALLGRPLVGISLEVTNRNERARALYQRLGFVAGNRLYRKTASTA